MAYHGNTTGSDVGRSQHVCPLGRPSHACRGGATLLRCSRGDRNELSTLKAPGSKVWTFHYNDIADGAAVWSFGITLNRVIPGDAGGFPPGQPKYYDIPNGMMTNYGYESRNHASGVGSPTWRTRFGQGTAGTLTPGLGISGVGIAGGRPGRPDIRSSGMSGAFGSGTCEFPLCNSAMSRCSSG